MIEATCVSRDQLQEYLSGWIPADESDAIEAHLLSCPVCEQTVAQLENNSDTLLESVRRAPSAKLAVDAAADADGTTDATPLPDAEIAAELDAEIDAALTRAKQLANDADSPAAFDQSSQPPIPWPEVPMEVGGYELLRPLGRGGMGTVYLARHRRLGKELAIKLLTHRLHRDQEHMARFQREMRAAGGLDHPAIVRATDAGEYDGIHYMAMDYIDGLDLSRLVRSSGKLSIADACEIARQVALGLSHAHAAGVIHRDIKPSNIMLSTTGQVKILDFGLARLHLWDDVSAELTTVGQLIGTLDYMAPEQADRPETVDYRADLYALGATLFRLLCGRAPLAASPEISPLAKLRLLATHEPPSLATLRPDAPEPLVKLTSALLARHPDGRPASAAHVAEQLEPLARDADLVGLLASAQQTAAERVEVLSPDQNYSQVQPVMASAPRPPRSPRSRRGLYIALFAPLALLAGILITLETQKGELVIESEAANVTVQLLRDGEEYDQLTIRQGATSTRLFAGRYEVTIEGGSDALVVQGETIDVRRGQVTVARILNAGAESPSVASSSSSTPATDSTTDMADAAPSLDPAAEIALLQQRLAQLKPATDAFANEPLYEGKPLTYWLDSLVREKSTQATLATLTALKALADKETSERITRTLMEQFPELFANPYVKRNALHALGAINPGQTFYRLLVDQLRNSEPDFQLWILQELSSRSSVQFTSEMNVPMLGFPHNAETRTPFIDWMREAVLQPSTGLELRQAGADYLWSVVEDAQHVVESEKQMYSQMLVSMDEIPDEYWLSKAPRMRSRGAEKFYQVWYPQLADEVQVRAIKVLGDPAADPTLVAHALLLLNVIYGEFYNRGELQDRTDEALTAIRTRLHGMLHSPDELFARASANELALGTAKPQSLSLEKPPVRINVSPMGDSRVTLVLELLQLIEHLDAASEFADELLALYRTTEPLAEEFHAIVPQRLGAIHWPSMEFRSLGENGGVLAGSEHVLSAIIHDRSFKMLPSAKQEELLPGTTSENSSRIDQSPSFEWAKRQISKYDRNDDQQLSADEWQHMVIKPTGADANGDGIITAEEYAKFRSK